MAVALSPVTFMSTPYHVSAISTYPPRRAHRTFAWSPPAAQSRPPIPEVTAGGFSPHFAMWTSHRLRARLNHSMEMSWLEACAGQRPNTLYKSPGFQFCIYRVRAVSSTRPFHRSPLPPVKKSERGKTASSSSSVSLGFNDRVHWLVGNTVFVPVTRSDRGIFRDERILLLKQTCRLRTCPIYRSFIVLLGVCQIKFGKCYGKSQYFNKFFDRNNPAKTYSMPPIE